MKYRGIKRIDLLLLTHEHSDHFGESKDIMKEFKISKVISSNQDNLYRFECGTIEVMIFPNKIELDYAFPSGHTSSAFATATSLALATKKWYVAVPVFAWSAGVGYSRIYVGQHYPSDVIMGALVGTGSAFICHWASKQLSKRKKSKMQQIK